MSENKLIVIGKHDKIDIKNFDSLEQFNDFYKIHEDEINKLSTVKLNRIYHIKDYKIIRRKINGKEDKRLCFQQVFKSNELNNDETKYIELEQSIDELNQKMKALEMENSKIKSQLIEIINVINSSN